MQTLLHNVDLKLVRPMALETFVEPKNRNPLLIASALMIVAIALVDWLTLPYVSLGFLYLFPIMLAAAFVPRPALLALGTGCAVLSEAFSSLDPAWRGSRLAFETLALVGCGLFVSELLRNRQLNLETQQRLRALVDTSPAAIVTVDQQGVIELANQAALEMLAPSKDSLIGEPIGGFVPELEKALRHDGPTQFRTSMQCQVRRGDGDTIAAQAWFSTYRKKGAPKLTAVIADISEDQPAKAQLDSVPMTDADRPNLNSREVAVLRLVFEGLSNNQMVSRLGVTTSVVKNTLLQLFSKTGVNNRSQMVRVALERYRDLV